MHLRLLGQALVMAGAATLAACGGATGTVEDTAPDTDAQADTAITSGTGDDSVTGTAAAGTGDDVGSTEIPEHPLDDAESGLTARTIYFEFDSSDIPESERSTIEAHASYLSQHPGAQVVLEGHADERGSREYNIALGEQRADAVRRLMTILGASSQQIRVISYGEERPASMGHDESAWQLNRRVEIVYRVRE